MTTAPAYGHPPACSWEDAEARTRSILDQSAEAFVELDSCGLVTDWNSQSEKIFGWPCAEVLGRDVGELIIPARNRARSRDMLHQFFRRANHVVLEDASRAERAEITVRAERAEITVIDRRGGEFQIQMMTFPIKCQRDYRMGILAQAVGAFRQTDDEAEQLHRNLMERLAEPYVEVDLRGKYVYFNKAYREAYGIQNDSSRIGVNYKDTIDSRRQALIREAYQEVYRSDTPRKIEYPLTTLEGIETYVELSVALRKNCRGEAIGFMAFARDHSARKRHETEMALARDAAEAASRAKSEFLANMSHEIRTPLNGVIGMLDLARDTKLSPEQSELLEIAHISAKSLLGLINDILDFSKIEAGKLEFDCAEFDLAETVAHTTRSLANNAQEKGLELAYSISPDVPLFLLGDSMRLRQVLVNLLNNAIKFTPQGEVVLRVTLEPDNAAAGQRHQPLGEGDVRLRFSVTDTGVGIDAGKQKLIFDAFSQADASTTRKFGGTGLGLAICSHIVQLMRGSIWVESELGKGSTFHATAAFGVSPGPQREPPDLAWLKEIPVLVVDDNLTNRRIVEATLSRWQMAVTGAASGCEALNMLLEAAQRRAPFQLVLADCHMPEMDGFQLIKQISRHPGISPTAIMMLAANDYAAAKRCRELGMAHLIKPVWDSDLLAALKVSLQRACDIQRATSKPIESIAPNGRGLRILLAEDNRVNQQLAARLLGKLGHHVVVAGNGQAALDALEAQTFDLVLMDVQMPEMDGYAATRAIRAQEQISRRHLPIVALTANAMTGDRELCLEAGMDDYIVKPINPSLLQGTIDRVMRECIADAMAPDTITADAKA